ncbi:MAG: DUF4040 domain-containing protein [Lachnospiraceae bacterium]|nr:DUF4040 domain-containing protein [Lachnospiraceae bacterium]
MSAVFILNTLVLAGIVSSAIICARSRTMIRSVIALAATGTFVGLEFILLQAPDVAIAEVAVGAVLSTVLYIIALYYTGAENGLVDTDVEPAGTADKKDDAAAAAGPGGADKGGEA